MQESKKFVLYKQVTIKGTNVVSNIKYLGIIIEDHFKFQGNVEHMHKKARRCLGLLQKLRNFNIDRKTLTMVYISMIKSILTCVIILW